MSTSSGPLSLKVKKDDILCIEGEIDNDLYFIHEGELLICLLKGSQITPLAKIKKGEYYGELSFFDHEPRSATVIATKDSELIRVPIEELEKQFPLWLYTMAKSIAKKIRKVDDLIRTKGLKKKNLQGIKPLTIEEQTYYFQLIKKEREKRSK